MVIEARTATPSIAAFSAHLIKGARRCHPIHGPPNGRNEWSIVLTPPVGLYNLTQQTTESESSLRQLNLGTIFIYRAEG
jgi:hypothetical protein